MSDNFEIQRVRVNRNAWRANLAKEIIHLEDNLDQIYYTAGLKPHRIVKENNDQDAIVDNGRGISQPEIRDYDSIIDGQVNEIRQAVDNICSLISSVTEFELPIPVLVLLKLANRISAIRCQDFKRKVPGTLAKKYVLSEQSFNLISLSLKLYDWVSTILSTNILPFQAFINQNLLGLLSWTRSSNLCDHSDEKYYTIRSQTISLITKMTESLSLNLNLDPKQLTSLIEDELIPGLDQAITSKAIVLNAGRISSNLSVSIPSSNGCDYRSRGRDKMIQSEETLGSKYACEVVKCLDRLFIVYANIMDLKLEVGIKSFVVQTCIKIYRDFEQSVVGLACRRQLLRLLETIANRPFATSTTELAWHIFELCEQMETDPEIRYIARRSIKIGLAHRPTIVSNFDVHDCYANRCSVENSDEKIETENGNGEIGIENREHIEENETFEKESANDELTEGGGAGKAESERSEPVEGGDKAEIEDVKRVEERDKVEESCKNGHDDDHDDDEQTKSYLDLFVDSPVTNVTNLGEK